MKRGLRRPASSRALALNHTPESILLPDSISQVEGASPLLLDLTLTSKYHYMGIRVSTYEFGKDISIQLVAVSLAESDRNALDKPLESFWDLRNQQVSDTQASATTEARKISGFPAEGLCTFLPEWQTPNWCTHTLGWDKTTH